MKLHHLNMLRFIPFKPVIRVDGKKVKVTYKELYKMYNRADYVARVIGQVTDHQPIINKSAVLSILYLTVHYNLKYEMLCQVIKTVNNFYEV